MKIDQVEAFHLRYEYPEDQRFQYAGGVCTARLTTVVRLRTDTGLTGVGSAYSHPGLMALVIDGQLRDLLIGQDPADIEGLWDRMYGMTRWYGRKGAAVTAIGAVDVALWDLRGKVAGRPVYELLGGHDSKCPAYASNLLWKDSPTQLAEEAAGYVKAGFRRMKMRLARTEEYDRAAVLAVQEAIGPENDLMVDASMRYHPELARRMGEFFAEQDVFWYEEPFAPEDLDHYAQLRGTVDVPIAAGENEFGYQGFRELARAGAVDILQPDVSRCGGLTETWRVLKLAEEHGLRVATHTWSDAIAVIANAHAVAASPAGITVEIDQTRTPFIDALLGGPLVVADGQLDLGDAPGLGIELDEDVLAEFRLENPLDLPPGSYSDMMFGLPHLPPDLPYIEAT
ncbi:MAG: mandelate racemase/muconate lactonizing enzyme family protein [Gemmatimonadetes bacterium]|nr:mandelate racemase/muconate lactonizing enzyme family protein [Gemmatimonadota bacterium]MBT7862334.1 mandelate racemase/muconate lactonizing enzyme family protein [Gemmatimonadota bacterium]